jgi:hypothetical protein
MADITDDDGRGTEWDEWEVDSHDAPTIVRFETDSGRITIYGGNADDPDPLVWDLYPCEASSLARALNDALLMCERHVGKRYHEIAAKN